MTSLAHTIQFIRDKFAELLADELVKALLKGIISKHPDGALLIVKYCDVTLSPVFDVAIRNSAKWIDMAVRIQNFDELVKDYDPKYDSLIYITVPHIVTGKTTKYYGQLIKIPLS